MLWSLLSSIEPASIPLLAVLAFSLSLYPLGFMLGASCSPCCDIPCGECATGKLPDTVTVTFDGYPDVGPAFQALFVSFDSCFGGGATASPTTAAGVITGVTVNNGGSGYATLARVEPTITADGPGGSGADITVTLTEEEDECGLPYWTISGLTIVDGGSGYTDGGQIVFTLGAGETQQSAAFALIQTSNVGEIESIDLSDGGAYYGEDPDAPALVAAITVVLEQIDPSDGAGAVLAANVDDDPDSPTFGKITSVTITNGGSGYEATGFPNTWCMGDYMNGKSFVLARSKFFGSFFNIQSYACEYRAYLCNPLALGTYSSAAIVFEYRQDKSTEPAKSLLQAPLVSLTTEEQIANCSSFTLEFPDKAQSVTAFNDVTATVVSGGGSVEDATGSPVVPSIAGGSSHATGVCGSCCLNEEATPAEVTINLEYLIESSFGRPAEGDYVLSRGSRLISTNANTTLWEGGFSYVFEGTTYAFTLEAAIEPCATLSNTGPGALNTFVAADCDDTCYKKCRLRINLYAGEFEFVPGAYNPGCDCIDFPVCSPPAGAYTLVSGAFDTPAYTATIS
jgi:hypothetical protein